MKLRPLRTTKTGQINSSSRRASHSSTENDLLRDFSPASDDDREYKPNLSESSSDTEIEETSGAKKKSQLKKSTARSSSSSCSSSSTSSRSNSSSSLSNTSSSSDSESDKKTESPPLVIQQSLPPLNPQSKPSPAKCYQNASSNELVEVHVPVNLAADLAMTSSEDEALQKSQNSPVLPDMEAEVENTTIPPDNNSPLSLKELANRFVNRLITPNTDSTATTTKKKRRRGSKKETAKLLRNLGLPYTSASKGRKFVGSRQLKQPCNGRCRLKCSERFSQDTRQQIFRSILEVFNSYL